MITLPTLVDEEAQVGDEDGEPPLPGEEVPVRHHRRQPLHRDSP